MKILFLSSWFPYPPINGAKIRVYNLIRHLARHHELTLLSFVQTFTLEEAQAQASWLEQYCRTVKVVQARRFAPTSLKAYTGFVSLKPRSLVQTYSPEMTDLIDKTMSTNAFDVVVASEVNAPSMVSLLASRIKGVPKVLDAIEVGLAKDAYQKQSSPLLRLRQGLTWLKLKHFTREVLRQATLCTVPSHQEKQNLLEIMPQHPSIEIVPHPLDLTLYTSSFGVPQPNLLVFTGSFTYNANRDAAFFFLEAIYPQIRHKLPEVNMQIVGNTGGVPLETWPIDDSIRFTGLLHDVRPAVTQSWVSVVPLRIGAGTRLKIVESMALGTPVVSTSKGAEGLEVVHGENILIADDPGEFAHCVTAVLQNPDLRNKLSMAGRQLVQEKYSSEIVGEKLNSLLGRIACADPNNR